MGKIISQLLLIIGLSLFTVGCGTEETDNSGGFNNSPVSDNADNSNNGKDDTPVGIGDVNTPDKDTKSSVEGVFVDTIVAGLRIKQFSDKAGTTQVGSDSFTDEKGLFDIEDEAKIIQFLIGTDLVIGSIDTTDVHADKSLKLIDLGKMFNTDYIYDTRVMFVSRLLLSLGKTTDSSVNIDVTAVKDNSFSAVNEAFATNTNLRGEKADEVLRKILDIVDTTLALKTEKDAESHLKDTHDKLMSKISVAPATADQCPTGGTVKTYSVDFSGNGVYETYTSVECAPTTVVERIKTTNLAGREELVTDVYRYFDNQKFGVDLDVKTELVPATDTESEIPATYTNSATPEKIFSFDTKCSDGGIKITHYQYEVGTYTIGSNDTTTAKLIGKYDEYQCSGIVRTIEMKKAKLVVDDTVTVDEENGYRINVAKANGSEVGDIVYKIELISELDGTSAGIKAVELVHAKLQNKNYIDFSDISFEPNNVCLSGGIERNYYEEVAKTEESAKIYAEILTVAKTFAVETDSLSTAENSLNTASSNAEESKRNIDEMYLALQNVEKKKVELEAAKYVETLTEEEKTTAEDAYTTYFEGDYKTAEDNYANAVAYQKAFESLEVAKLAKAKTDAYKDLLEKDRYWNSDWDDKQDLLIAHSKAQGLDYILDNAKTAAESDTDTADLLKNWNDAIALDKAVEDAQNLADNDTPTNELYDIWQNTEDDAETDNNEKDDAETDYNNAVTLDDDLATAKSNAEADISTSILKSYYDDAVKLDEAFATAQTNADADSDTKKLDIAHNTADVLYEYINKLYVDKRVAGYVEDAQAIQSDKDNATETYYICHTQNDGFTPGVHSVKRIDILKSSTTDCQNVGGVKQLHRVDFNGNGEIEASETTQTETILNEDYQYSYHEVSCNEYVSPKMAKAVITVETETTECKYGGEKTFTFVYNKTERINSYSIVGQTSAEVQTELDNEVNKDTGEYFFQTVECSGFEAHEYNLTKIELSIPMGKVDDKDTKCPYGGGKTVFTMIYAGSYNDLASHKDIELSTSDLVTAKLITVDDNDNYSGVGADSKIIDIFESTFCYGDDKINTFEQHTDVGSVKIVDEFTSCQEINVTVYRHPTYTNYTTFIADTSIIHNDFKINESSYTTEVCTTETPENDAKKVYVKSDEATIIDAYFDLPICKDENGDELIDANAKIEKTAGTLSKSTLGSSTATLSDVEAEFRLVTIQTTDDSKVRVETSCNGEIRIDKYSITVVKTLDGFIIPTVGSTTGARQFTYYDAMEYAKANGLILLTIEEYVELLAVGGISQYGDYWSSNVTQVLENNAEVDMPVAINLRSDKSSQIDENQAKENRKFVAFKTDSSVTKTNPIDFVLVGGENRIQANWTTANEICTSSGLVLPSEADLIDIYFVQNKSSVEPKESIQNGEYWTSTEVGDVLANAIFRDEDGNEITDYELSGDETITQAKMFSLNSDSYHVLSMNKANYKNVICIGGTDRVIIEITEIAGTVKDSAKDENDDNILLADSTIAYIALTKQGMPVINGLQTTSENGVFEKEVNTYALSGYIIEVHANGYYPFIQNIDLTEKVKDGDNLVANPAGTLEKVSVNGVTSYKFTLNTITLVKRDTQVEQPVNNPLKGNVNNGCENKSAGVTCDFLSADWEITEIDGTEVGVNQLKSDVTQWKYEITDSSVNFDSFTVGLDAVSKIKASDITSEAKKYEFTLVSTDCPNGIIWSTGVKAPLKINFTDSKILMVDVPTPICKADLTKVNISAKCGSRTYSRSDVLLKYVDDTNVITNGNLVSTNAQVEVSVAGCTSTIIGISGGNDTFEQTVELTPTKEFDVVVNNVVAGENVSVRIAGFETKTTNVVSENATSITVIFDDVPHAEYDIEIIYDGRNIVKNKVNVETSNSVTINFPDRTENSDEKGVVTKVHASASSCFTNSSYELNLIHVTKNTSFQFNFDAQKTQGNSRLNGITLTFTKDISSAIKNISRGGVVSDNGLSITWKLNGGGNFEFNLAEENDISDLGTKIEIKFDTAATDSNPNTDLDLSNL